MRQFFVACALAGLCMTASGADWYVATTGSDSNDGSEASPFKTPNVAVSSASAGDVIHVAAGTYTISSVITLNKAITLEGAGPEVTTLSSVSTSGNNAPAVFSVTHADAIVSGVKITKSSSSNVALTISSGMVTNCMIRSCLAQSTYSGKAIKASGGLIVDCKIMDSGNPGNSKSGSAGCTDVSGSATFRSCLFTGNYVGYGRTVVDHTYGGGGAMFCNPGSGKTVTLENCTFANNTGMMGGAILFGTAAHAAAAGTVNMTRCVFAGNKLHHNVRKRGATTCSKSFAYVTAGSLTVNATDCLFDDIPEATEASSAVVNYSGCVIGRDAGYVDERGGVYTLDPGSPAYGWGWNAASRGAGFSCAIETPATNKAIGSLAVTLNALTFNAPAGDAVYEWDLDGDGVYDVTGQTSPSLVHTFTTPGWHRVGLAVAIGGDVAESTAENLVYVCPTVIEVKSNGSGTFPYATQATAANTLTDALKAAVPGSKIHIASGTSTIEPANLRITVPVEIYGDSRETSVIRRASSGAQSPLCFIHDGVFMHDLKLAIARENVLVVCGDSIVSNCWMTSGGMSTGYGVGLSMYTGLVTHSLISGNSMNNGQGAGCELGGTAILRNSVIRGNKVTNGTGSGNGAGVYMTTGTATLENCTIYGNTCVGASAKCAGVCIGGDTTPISPTIRNNIIWGNTAVATSGTATEAFWVKAGTPVVTNNCCNYDIGGNCVTGDPAFADAANGDFSITTASPCANKGLTQEWMTTTETTDYGGNVRVSGSSVDIGAYEADSSVLVVSFDASTPSGPGAQDITFTLTGDYDQMEPGTVYRWDFDGDGVYDVETTATSVTASIGEGLHDVTLKAGALDPVTRTGVVDIKAVTVYAARTGSTPAYPYNTWATAASSIASAMNAATDGSTIVLSNGTFSLSSDLNISSSVTIRGLSGCDGTTITPSQGHGLSFQNADAIVEGVTISGGSAATMITMGAIGGTFRDSRVRDCVWSTMGGIAIKASGGLVEGVEIVNCRDSSDGDGGDGMAVQLSGTAVMRNSVIRNCRRSSGAGNDVIRVTGNARLENCTISGNKTKYPALYASGNAQIVNCIAYGNETWYDTSSAGSPNWRVGGSTCVFSNNIFSAACGETDIAGDPEFTDAANGDFTFNAGSIAFNAGILLDWMNEEGAKDFYGNVRLSGAAPDIGAFEADANQENVVIALSATSGTGPTPVTLTAVATGFELSGDAVVKWFWTSDGEGGEEPDAVGNGVVATFGTGVHSVYLKVENADGDGAQFSRRKLNAIRIYPSDVYVTAAGGDGAAAPYDTVETAATNILDAVAAAGAGTVVHLLPGTHAVAQPVSVSGAMAFVGAGQGVTTLSNAAGSTNSVFALSSNLAVVSNLTIHAAGSPMVSIAAGGGILEDVTLSGAVDCGTSAGGALRMLGGTVRRCRVTGNACGDTAQCPVFIRGGILEDCLVAGNASSASGEFAAGGIFIDGGTARNCTVVGNVAASGSGGVSLVIGYDAAAQSYRNPLVQNTVMWGGSCASQASCDNWKAEFASYGKFSSCCTYPAIGGETGNIASEGDPGFADYGHGLYTPALKSVLRNGGQYAAWMATAKDLAGNARSKGSGKVDIGCYECQARFGMSIIVR